MRLVVLGGGESGVGTAILGKKKGYDVFVSDFGKIKENYKEVLTINGIAWEDEKHTEELILNANVVIKFQQSKIGLQFYFHDSLFSDNGDVTVTLRKFVVLHQISFWYI